MLRVEMSREEVLAKVRAELSYAQPDDRLVRLRRLIMSIKSITEIVDRYHQGNLDLVQALNEIKIVLTTIQNSRH